jgi:hypothetical protein
MLNNDVSWETESSIPKKLAGIREFRSSDGITLFSPHTNLGCYLSGPAAILWDCLNLTLEASELRHIVRSVLDGYSVPIPLNFSTEINDLLKRMHAHGLIEFKGEAALAG